MLPLSEGIFNPETGEFIVNMKLFEQTLKYIYDDCKAYTMKEYYNIKYWIKIKVN